MAAGLGGGSADAAAALVGLNTLWDARMSARDLVRLGAELGSDVPFFFTAAPRSASAAARSSIRSTTSPDVGRHHQAVVRRAHGGGVPLARRGPPAGCVSPDAAARVGEIDFGWPSGPVPLVNDLQGPVAGRHPAINEMVDALKRAGARAAAMTGSGSAVFGVFPASVPRTALRSLQRPDWLVLLTRTSDRREAARRIWL